MTVGEARTGGHQKSPTPRPHSRLIVRHCRNDYLCECLHLMHAHGFEDLCRLGVDPTTKPKLAHLRDLILDLSYVLRHLGTLRQAREIVAVGWMSCNVALLLKLGLLPACRRMYWYGLFIHSPRWLRILRPPLRFLDSARISYVFFSRFEEEFYKHSLSLREGTVRYVPFGEMWEEKASPEAEASVEREIHGEKFFFSGGVSNRDYPPLIEMFRSLPHRLVIVCSSLNTEVKDSMAPPNVKILRDIPSPLFNAYARASGCCILPIAHDTGAAGQSCLLRYMKYRKVIIATDTGIIREYVSNGVSAILVGNNHEAMARAITEVGRSPKEYKRYGEAAYERFRECYSADAVTRALDRLVDGDPRSDPAETKP